MFWDQLRLFWPEGKIIQWKEELFPGGIDQLGTETVANLVTLSCDVHALWNRGAFALQPISLSGDKTTLEVRFFWQKKQGDMTTINLLDTPFSTRDLDRNNKDRLFDVETGITIHSGDIFTFQTDDPILRPLPSFALLELQFFLTRIAGMTGAAISYDLDWDDDDGDVSDRGLGNIEDTTISFDDVTTPLHLPEDLPDRHKLTEDSKQAEMGGADSLEVQGAW